MEKRLSIRKIVVAGVLGAIAILLGVTQLGYIPVPSATGHATIMHVPAIIGGLVEGPIVGAISGLIFGVHSFLYSPVPMFKDPLVSILPRLFIGIVAYFTYVGIRRINEYVAIGVASFIGSLTNTVLVLGMVVLRGYLSPEVAQAAAITSGIPEAIVSVIISLAVVVAWKKLGTAGNQKSKVSGDL
ncbi:ECF transporter S component [Risungbinella massiliensis]|uniref:ECF transporter S component n=1 Tax=Risungbinella massiliensis TaxID=1329796 RepID=UPI0005CC8EE9|nr:ECF transporter S component [Risungbinella massiliensis]